MPTDIPGNPLTRAALGLLLAAVVAAGARKTRTLSRSGAIAAVAAGTSTLAAGWSWGFLLIALFVTGSALSKFGESRKSERVGAVVAKGGQRDARQVAANGGVFVAAALGSLIFGGIAWQLIGIGALAAAAADTWSTEIGTLADRMPRLIVSGRKVPPGTSGAVTLRGMLGTIAGAATAAVGARVAEWNVPVLIVLSAGVGGAIADSLLGATIQSRRWCGRCDAFTERATHICGTATTRAGGIAGFGNDAVNFAATIIGGALALMLGRLGGLV